MVTILPKEDIWGDIGREFGSGISQGYMNRSDENAVKKAITDLGPNASARDIVNALTNVRTFNPKAKQEAYKNYLGLANYEELQRKAKEGEALKKAKNEIAATKETREKNEKAQERANTKAIVEQLDLPTEQKTALGEALSQSAAEGLFKEQFKPKEDKLTPFEKKVQEKNAEDYVNLTKEIPELETNEGDIDYAEKLSKDLGVSGVVTGALGLSEKAKELEAVSFTLMKPIVKIFNPSGPIAQQKLKMIQDKYVIKATDAPWTKQAKINGLRRFNKQALKRAKDRLTLYKKYDGNPPDAEKERFDKESDTLSDAMIDYDLVGEEVKAEGMPDPAQFKGKTVTSPEGQKFHSDGTRWVKK